MNQPNPNYSPQNQPVYYPGIGQQATWPQAMHQQQFVNQEAQRRMKLEESRNAIKKYQTYKTGFEIFPDQIKFANQNQDEKVFVFVRRHWSENISWFSRNISYFLIPWIILFVLNLLQVQLDFITSKEIGIIIIAFYSIIATNLIKDFTDWYYDSYIITNERIISYEFKPFAKYQINEGMLQDIQAVKEVSAGLLANLFGYGTVEVAFEGPREPITFLRVSSPTKIRDILTDLVKIAKKSYGST